MVGELIDLLNKFRGRGDDVTVLVEGEGVEARLEVEAVQATATGPLILLRQRSGPLPAAASPPWSELELAP